MKGKAIAGLRRLVPAALVATGIAGCAGQPPDASAGTVVVVKVAQSAWNAPPEPGLYRVTFDATRAREIRREALDVDSMGGGDSYHAEMRALNRHAERELKARGLCSGSARLVTYLEGSEGQSGIAAIFKCSPPIF